MARIQNFDEFPVEHGRRHDLPFKKIRSRLASAIILSFRDRKKHVTITLLTLTKSSRAFIITQGGLPGFLLDHHNNSMSWLYELQMSAQFRREMACYPEQIELEDLPKQLAECKTDEEKETYLRHVYPATYVAFLRTMGRTEELNELFDGTITPENYTWYLHAELLPKISKLRSEGRLKIGKKTITTFLLIVCRLNKVDQDRQL